MAGTKRRLSFDVDDVAGAPGLSDSLRRAMRFMLRWEAMYYTVTPGDAGGPTSAGVTQGAYDDWREEEGMPPSPVSKITAAEVAEVYVDNYARPVRFDELPYAPALAMFDAAVNCGTSRSVSWLQAVLGINRDGLYGPNTRACVKAYLAKHGAMTLALALVARRVDYYESIGAPGKANNRFLKGWLNRAAALRAEIGAG